jgi:hypothetical protein
MNAESWRQLELKGFCAAYADEDAVYEELDHGPNPLESLPSDPMTDGPAQEWHAAIRRVCSR